MTNWPTRVKYVERLAVDSTGAPSPIELDVEIPATRNDAFDLLATIDRLSREDPGAWKAMARQATATSWFMMGLFLSGAQRLDPFTGRPEMDCDFLWNHYQEMQFEGDGALNMSARGHHKSHIRGYAGVTCVIVNDPNEVIAYVAHEKMAAARQGIRTMLEWENNVELKAIWSDVFFENPRKDPDCTLWNQESGAVVRRTIAAALPTISWHAIEHVPTGSRISLFLLDDLETEDTVESDTQREKLLARFSSFLETAGRIPRIWINGTPHHPNGLVSHLVKSKAYKVVCHSAEDTSLPAPDIAALYDAADGKLPLRDGNKVVELPPGVREIRLDGAPTFMHPLELAFKRYRAMSTPGGLATYYRQNMGDALAGEDKRLSRDWIRYYDVDPIDAADGAFIYICVDPSKGVGDPTYARVEACRSDGTIAWVGGLRKRIQPSDFGREIWLLGCQWEGIGVIKEFRFEDVAQSTWHTHFIAYCEKVRHWPGGIGPDNVKCVPARAVNYNGGGGQKRMREWMRLEPMYKAGKRVFPRRGVMLVEDEKGRRFDLVEQYEEEEYGMFPLPITDDGLDADALLAAPEDKKRGIFPLEFPESEEEAHMKELRGWRRARRRGDVDVDEDKLTWMSYGL